MDTTKAMTVIVEQFEQDGGMMVDGDSGSQLPSKAGKLRVALLHWLANISKNAKNVKAEDIKQIMGVAKECINFCGAVFLPNNVSEQAGEQMDTHSMILWIFERFFNILSTVDIHSLNARDTLDTMNALIKLLEEFDSNLFMEICRHLSAFFYAIVQIYVKDTSKAVVKLALSDLEFFTEDFDLKKCCLSSDGVIFNNITSINRIVTHLLSVFSENFTALFITGSPICLFELCCDAVVALEYGDPTVKLKSLQFLQMAVVVLHKSLRSRSILEPKCVDTLMPIIFADICSVIKMFTTTHSDSTSLILKHSVDLLSNLTTTFLNDCCSNETVCEIAEICVTFLMSDVKFDPKLLQAFTETVVAAGKRDRRLLLTGRIFDLLEFFLTNPPKFDDSLATVARSVVEIVSLLYSDASNSSSTNWIRPSEESDFSGIFSRPDSPSTLMPAKRQKTSEEPPVTITSSSLAAFCKKHPLIGVVLRHFSIACQAEQSYNVLVVGSVLFSTIHMSLAKATSDVTATFASIIRTCFSSIQNSLMHVLESKETATTATLTVYLSFFQHVMTPQWPDKFFDSNQLLVFIGLASLPWLCGQQNWSDLRLPPSVAKSFLNYAAKIATFDRQFLEIAIDCVTLLPREIFPQWRPIVFRECLKSPTGVTRAIQRFPLLLHILGPTSNSLVYELLHQHVVSSDKNDELLFEVAAIVGDLACVISRQASVERENCCSLSIKCSCQQQTSVGDGESLRSASSRAVDAAMFLPLTNVLSTVKSNKVRRQLAISCAKMFSHLSFTQPASIDLLKNSCLPLLTDEDDTTRLLFAESLSGVADIGEELKTAFLDKISQVEKASQVMAYSHISAISSLLRNAQEGVFSALLTYLVNCSLMTISNSSEARLSGSVAENLLADAILRHNPERPFMVFVECAADLGELLCSRLISAANTASQIANGDKDRARRRGLNAIFHIFENICRTFRFTDFEHCFSMVMPALLPRLVIASSADMTIRVQLLELLAEQVRMTPRHLLSEHIVRIWTFVLCYAQTAQAIEAANCVVKAVAKSNLDEMVSRDGQKTCFQLVSKLGVNFKQAVKGLRFLAEHEQPTGQKLSDGQFVDYLSQRFLGILLFLDTQFQSTNVCPSEKLSLVSSLYHLLQIMGASHVNTVRVKLLATLRIILKLKTKKFLEAALKAWALFVKCLEPDNLAHLLPQILVSLLPLMKLFPGHVDAIFENVFNTKTAVIQKCVDDISYIVVDMPEFVSHLKSVPDVAAIRRSPKHFAIACSRGCANESSEVRLLALNRLKTYLAENQNTLVVSMGVNTLEQEWGPVLGQLLKCCHDTDFNVRLTATEVFGLFGAVDPSRIPNLEAPTNHLTNSNNLTLPLNEVTTDTSFAYNLIMDVCRVFLAADDTKVQDAAAYALQQLLATFGVNESLLTSSQLQTNSSFGIRLWNRFTMSTQQLLKPYLKTKYVLTVKFDPSQVKTPFFGSNDRYSQYKEWLCTFTHYLIQSLPASSSNAGLLSTQLTNCFQACKAIVRYDAALALFLLPFIALHVVTNSQQDSSGSNNLTNEIGLELQTVVDACVAVNDHRLVVANSTVNTNFVGGREGGTSTPPASLTSQVPSAYVSSQLPMAAQAAFIVIDHLTRWLETANLRNAAHQQRATQVVGRRGTANADLQPLPPAIPLLQVEAVTNFLRKIPPLSLAIAAANCRYPARAMRYFEEHIANSTVQNSQGCVVTTAGANFLQKLYMHLGEPDGVLGVDATFCQQPTIEQNILRHEINGQLSDALTCYEQAIEQQPDNFDFNRGVIGCLLSLGRDTAALHTVAGIVGRQEDTVRQQVQSKFLPYQVEALGRLSDWSRLENFLKPPDSSLSTSSNTSTVVRTLEWPIGFWSAVVSLRRSDPGGFNDAVISLRRAELGPLSAASLEAASYVRGYDSIVKMHVLAELEMLANYLLSNTPTYSDQIGKNTNKIADTLSLFDMRLAMTEKSLAVREPLLQFRRLATKLLAEDGSQQMLSGLNSRIGRLWLASARLARKAGRYETAYGHILAATSYADQGELRLETAKWLWARGSREDALALLERWLTSKNGSAKDQLNARMLCLWTRYNEETAMLDSGSLVKQYRAVVESNPRSEESYFYLAKYLSKLLLTASEQPGQPQSSNRNSIGSGTVATPVTLPDGSLTLEAVRNFGHSLRYGSKFIFESMPQLVSLWLDYALAVHNYSLQQQQQNSTLANARQTMMGINAEIKAMLGPVPAYQFLVVFPQLISRICHPQRETAAVLLEVAAYVMSTYPQQTTWLAIAVSRSMWPLRRKRCEELFARLRQLKAELNQFIADISRLTDRLCEVCDKVTDRDPESEDSKLLPLSVSRDFRQMKRLVEEQSFSRILIPLQHLLWPTLPTSRRGNPASNAQHQAFPSDEIYFAGFGDEVEVMRSLQRPKRLLVRGSNGKLYGFLCKPKEDLRKDSRWMEYVTVVNSLLGRDPDASRRRLSIRTFAVIPLNEDCGIIEWVDHTHGIRPILLSIYRERGIMKDQKFLISCKLPADAPLSEKLKVFKTRLLPSHPAVLGDWFRRNWFADASAWHEARLAFSRSAAVMSIAGYILGLGDRHGENILIDAKSGEVVHVDFSCLFNKADAFEYPEVVPFRLTHNMLHAMGPTGYEGVFRKACEVTMRIMRHHSDALMIVLKSFVHDPLVEWQKPVQQNSSKTKRAPGGDQQGESGGEVINSQAVKVLSDTRNRLKGCVTSSSVDLPLSIEGHVNYVIRQATDEANLARMYIGWGAQL